MLFPSTLLLSALIAQCCASPQSWSYPPLFEGQVPKYEPVDVGEDLYTEKPQVPSNDYSSDVFGEDFYSYTPATTDPVKPQFTVHPPTSSTNEVLETGPSNSCEQFEKLRDEIVQIKLEIATFDERFENLKETKDRKRTECDEKLKEAVRNAEKENHLYSESLQAQLTIRDLKSNLTFIILNGQLDVVKNITSSKCGLGLEPLKTSLQGKTYLISPSNLKESWARAKQLCESCGFQLAGAETKEEHEALRKALSNEKDEFYTSGTNAGKDYFYWASSNQTFRIDESLSGSSGSTIPGQERCVHYWNTGIRGGGDFRDVSLSKNLCSDEFRFICEI